MVAAVGVVGCSVVRAEAESLVVTVRVGILGELVLRSASVEGGRLHGSAFRWGGWTQ